MKNTPQLRFKEFKEAWVKQSMESFADFKSGFAFPSGQMTRDTGKYQVIKMSNVYQNELRLDRNPSFINELDNKNQDVLLKKGDVIITLTGTVGKTDFGYSIVIDENDKYLLNQRLILLRPKKDKSCSTFLRQLVLTEQFLYYFFGEAKGGTGNQSNVGIDDVKNINQSIPTLPEQQKIAAFLTAVDEKLQALQQKKILLEQYKKGLMQKIFSQELRFKDEKGKKFPDWEVKKLGEVLVKFEQKSEFSNQYPILTSARTGLYFQKDYFADHEVASKDNTGYNVVPRNYFTYRHMSDDLTFKFNINNLCDFGIVSTLYPVFTTKGVNDEFLKLLLNEGPEFRNFAIMQKQGGSRTYMYFGTLCKLEVKIPCLDEQNKITNFLLDFELKINSTQTQIDQFQTWKKGLLQQMFV